MEHLTREEYLKELERISQENPMLIELAFSLLKLNELDIISDEDMNSYLKELEKKKDLLKE
ncbi:MAG: hypothetical protein R3Y47_01600 [Lachnospiraceae bacterium]